MEQAILIPTLCEKVFARDLVDGQQVETAFVVREVSRRAKRNGEAFLKLQLGDVTGRVEGVCWDGVEAVAEAAAPGTVVIVRGTYSLDERFGVHAHRARRAPRDRGRVRPAGPTRVRAGPVRADGGRPARADRHRAVPAPAPAARPLPRARGPDLAALEHLAGGQALPPGLPARAARALPLGRAGSQRDGRHLPRARPRRRGHRRAPARHREDRGVRDGGRLDRPLRHRQAPGRDRRSATTSSGARSRRSRASRPPRRRRSSTSSSRTTARSSTAARSSRARARPRSCTRSTTSAASSAASTGSRRSLQDGERWSRFDRALDGSGVLRARATPPSQPAKSEKAHAPVAQRRAAPDCRLLMLGRRGQGHREADPSALADLVPDGRAAVGHGTRDQAGGRGLLGHERRRVRAPLLRRPRGARVARDRPQGRQAGRRLVRGGELHAAARELLPARDRVLGRGARRAADGAQPARRRVRLRGAAAARAPAGLLGEALAARHARTSSRSRSPRPPRPAARELSQRLSKVETAIFRRKTIVFDYYTIGRDAEEKRKVDPYQLLYQRGQFY